MDYRISGWLKDKVYARQVNTPEDLRGRIVTAADELRRNREALREYTQSLLVGARKCIGVYGEIFEHLI